MQAAETRDRAIASRDDAMLLTGFESYGGRSLNPSEQVVERLAGTEIGGIRVVGHTLPVSYREIGPRIAELIEESGRGR